MFARVHCTHCDKSYETFSEDIKLMKSFNKDAFRFANNTYYYESKDCFFTTVKKLKNSSDKINNKEI